MGSNATEYQDLSLFRLDSDFIGKPKWVLFLWESIYGIFFKHSPRILYGWRRFLLRLFGAKIGKQVVIRPSAEFIYPWKVTIGDFSWIGDNTLIYSLGLIDIGKHVVISQSTHLCGGGHNYVQQHFPTYQKPITIEDECWIATDVFIGPGVTIGKGAVVGARSSVYKDLEGGKVYAGNPAKYIKDRIMLVEV